MGGNIALEMAYRHADVIRAVIALEASARTPGRLNEYFFTLMLTEVNWRQLISTVLWRRKVLKC